MPPSEPSAPAWVAAHEAACARGDATYIDPATGYSVFTAVGLEARGRCCGAGCRHCPFAHARVRDKAGRIQQPAWLCDPTEADIRGAVDVVFWSGGKDSFLALRAWLAQRRREGVDAPERRVILLSTFDAVSRVVAHQELPIRVLVEQAEALALPMIGVPLHAGAGYVERIADALELLSERGATCESLVFGDLHLEHIRAWREEAFAELGPELAFPLWGLEPEALLEDLERSGVRCVVSARPAPDDEAPAAVRIGAVFDREMAEAARAHGWDAFGENGEFHTLAEVARRGRDALARLPD